MKFRRQGKQLDTEAATTVYKCRSFSIMKNSANSLFYVKKKYGKDPKFTSSYEVRLITEEEARKLVKENDPNAEFRVFEKRDYDIRIQLDEEENSILFEMAYKNGVDKKKMLMEIIKRTLCEYQKEKDSKKSKDQS